MEKPPCYQCTRRSAVCHADCVAYREWVADRRKMGEEARKDSEGAAYAQDNRERWRRRKNLK